MNTPMLPSMFMIVFISLVSCYLNIHFLGNEEVGESMKKAGGFDDFEVNGNM